MYKSKVKISPLVQGDGAVPWNAYTDGYAMRFPDYNLYWAAETRYAKISDVITFFFINGIFKTLIAQKLPRYMFIIKSFLQMCLYSNAYDMYLFLEISENKNTEYLTPAI